EPSLSQPFHVELPLLSVANDPFGDAAARRYSRRWDGELGVRRWVAISAACPVLPPVALCRRAALCRSCSEHAIPVLSPFRYARLGGSIDEVSSWPPST